MTRKGLLDDDGENRAVRSFLMIYGASDHSGYTAGAVATHMRACGWDVVPDWADAAPGMHLTKAGAQIWLRMLFDLEKQQ